MFAAVAASGQAALLLLLFFMTQQGTFSNVTAAAAVGHSNCLMANHEVLFSFTFVFSKKSLVFFTSPVITAKV